MTRTSLVILFGLALVIASLLLVTGCSYNSVASGSSNNPPANEVYIKDFSFQPDSLLVTVGTTVKWTNKGSITHTVTSDGGAFGSGNIASNGTFSWTFKSAGTFPYHCAIHTSMYGKIVVQ